jgi:hypothetical protein
MPDTSGARRRVAGSRAAGRTRGRAGRAPAALALGLVATACAGARDDGHTLYQWSDRDGVVRFTSQREEIPRRHRLDARPVEPGLTAQQNAELLPGARTSPAVAEPGAADWTASAVPDAEADPFNAPEEARRMRDDRAAVDEELAEIDRRIAELEIAIARDEEAIQFLISDPEASQDLHDSEELAAIGRRMPDNQAKLKQLRERRARVATSDGP